MALPVVIPNTFANANASIPLSQLDNNFSTVAVSINGMANGAEALANVNITGGSIANASLSNVSISSGNVTINVANVTTLDATNVEVTNIKAKDGTASATIADSTGVMTIGSSVLTTTDINGGTIDGAVIGGSSAAAGSFTTLSANDQITSTMGNNATLFNSASATTGYQQFNIQNTGAQTRFGIENSAGGGQLPGSSAYSGYLGNVTNTDFHIFTNNTIRGTFSSTGLAVTGALSATQNLSIDSGGVTAYASPSAHFLRNHGGQSYTNNAGLDIYWNTSNGSGESELVFGNLSTSFLRFMHNNAGAFAEIARVSSTGLAVTGAISASGNVTVGSATAMSAGGQLVVSADAGSVPTGGNYYNIIAKRSGTAGFGSGIALVASNTGFNRVGFGDTDSIEVGFIEYDHTSNFMRFAVSGSERLRIDSSGNVGIGTSSPTTRLQIGDTTVSANNILKFGKTASAAQSTLPYISQVSEASAGTSNDLQLFAGGSGAGRIILNSFDFVVKTGGGTTPSGAERLRIDSSGNVGIGTSSPSSYYTGTGLAVLTGTGTAITIATNSGASNGYLYFADGTTGSQQYAGYIQYNHTSDVLILATNAAERLRIDSSGNVGIGGTSFGSGAVVLFMANATTAPTTNPTGGGILYVEGGALKYRGSSGTVTTIANA